MSQFYALVAQDSGTAPGPAPANNQGNGQGAGGLGGLGGMLPLILMVVVFMFIMSRGKSKERKRFEEMLNSLKRNDRVQTIGGIIGTVVDVRDNEVVLKIDESTNTKMRFNRGAIKEVIQDTGSSDAK